MTPTTRFALAALALAGMAGCGGGSTSDSLDTAGQPVPPEPATVGILLTDAHGTRWDQAFATVTSIELLGDGYRASIFEGSETIDLLSLPDYFELFAVADDIPPGDVSKVRLQLDLLELVDLDELGNEVERMQTKLVGNGKIDINPRRIITILGGETIFVEIDFDMEKAFKTTETGSGEIIVRPVVFANFITDGQSSRLTRLFGTVESRNEEDTSFVLCQTALFAHHDEASDDHNGRCITIDTDGLTGFFGADGLPVTFLDVAAGDVLTAIGFLRRIDDDDEDPIDDLVEDDFLLDAVTVEIGADFERYAGTAQSGVVGDLFDLMLDPAQGFETGTVLPTQLFASTRVFSSDGGELDLLSIAPDVGAIVDGVIAPGGDGGGDVLRAALVVLDFDVSPPLEVLRGEIVSVDDIGSGLQLLVDGLTVCVDAAGADVFLISTGDGLASESGGLGDLVSGMAVDVYGHGESGECFRASDILADVGGS